MVRLRFLGTRGEIEESSPGHQYHSSLLVTSDRTRILIDYGRLRRYSLEELNPQALLITHAHPDHYAWLEEPVPSPATVYLTAETLEYGRYRPEKSKVIKPRQRFNIGGIEVLAYRVIHSIRCPAVGYRLETEGKTLVYNPDLVDIVEKEDILAGVDYYIGDGSAIKANLVRRRGDTLFGHTRTTTQINWCRKSGIAHIIFTHLGKETLENEDAFAAEHPEAVLAYDGLEMEI